jgi:hypothetical protein
MHDDLAAETSGATGPSPESRVEVRVTKSGEGRLYIMYDAADPGSGKLYFTEAEWNAFILGVKGGEFDLDDSGNLP